MAALARFVSFLILASLSVLSAAAGAGWHQLTAAQQEALTPLAAIWDTLPGGQQQALLRLSAGYGALDARGQRLFHERLLQWTLLTPAQRQLARENFRRLRNMPAAQQAQIRQRWQQACEPPVKP
ncbi:MAG: DUF3106 domain-containing protein [Thiobacillaceae bacterium]